MSKKGYILEPEGLYEELIKGVFANGTQKGDRTGTGTISWFGPQLRYDLRKGFPLVNTKSVPFKMIAKELQWFLKGETNILPLLQQNVHIWTEWAFKPWLQKTGQAIPVVNSPEWNEQMAAFEQRVLNEPDFAAEYGELGPVYGSQWRAWQTQDGRTIDQIANLIEQIRKNPDSRRLMVTAWNPGEVDSMALPPCHALFQLYVADGRLSCKLYQRSADVGLGVPFNIASYALLTHMIAHVTNLEVGDFIWTGGDVHVYNNHIDKLKEQIEREVYPFPELSILGEHTEIDSITLDDLVLTGYEHHPAISLPIAV